MRSLERKARSIFDAVIADCDPEAAFDRAVDAKPGAWIVGGESVDLRATSDVRVLALGKPSLALVRGCVRALDRAGVPLDARRGVAALPAGDAPMAIAAAGPWLAAESAGHPLPDVGSFRAGRTLLDVRERHVGLADFAILSAGTDGVDGSSSAAGAIVTPEHVDLASSLGLDAAAALASFDSAGFLAPLGAQIECGPTGTNVRDLRVFIGVGG